MKGKAYNPTWAHHEAIRQAATRWQRRGLLSALQLAAIHAAHPLDYYRPNIFLRITLFVFTLIGAMAGGGMLLLMLSGFLDDSDAVIPFSILGAGATLFVLEAAISGSRLYHSGIDNALLYITLSWLAFLITYTILEAAPVQYQQSPSLFNPYITVTLLLVLALLLAATIRYADRLVATVAYLAYLLLVASVLLQVPAGSVALPFALMLASVAAYGGAKKLTLRSDYLYYKPCIQLVQALCLVSFYMGGNYYAVREGNALLSDAVVAGQVPFAWLFYFFTATLPVIYIVVGLRRPNRIWLLIGLLALGFSVFTFRYYHSVLPPELAATLAGAALVAAMIWVTRYLRVPHHGLTTAADDDDATRNLNLESLIVAETATVPQPAAAGFEFGGGSSGGGGADGNY
ncbi:hypothetical protein MTX78_02440 [Hymenobacter tibetensis]|uniref:DUF2157 domain-containing protein n=1 Tax=Hymenobacter tibetensis TaxID=497967 RepID=A0ABY4CZ85_9BACT|nr:hypothetical protein [Hymenobacter tibetensis]UOG75463.1 hypothetical protein MTX78_02440 [Hymenobacter tibetensis]